MKTHKNERHILQARENVDTMYSRAFNLARDVVERAYPEEDVKILRHFKNKVW
jgi:hypothetical protein